MGNATTYVGLDVHKNTIAVAVLGTGSGMPTTWQVANDPSSVRRLGRRLISLASGPLACCYEAGPCGYALQRQLAKLGIACQVIAPSLIPIRPGERIKTDPRDARKLAELLRAGLLTEVRPPSEAEESVRDLCRCREAVGRDLTRARHRLGKFLLRRGCTYTQGKKAWGTRHRRWLQTLSFEHPAERYTFDTYLLAVEQLEERRRLLDEKLAEVATTEPYRDAVAWLRCFRGIEIVTALSIVAELHDFRRFRSPRALMAYLGLVPSERSSGNDRRQGSITRTGNGHVRRLLVEAAWHYRHRPEIGVTLRERRKNQTARVIAIADRAQARLWSRRVRMNARGKPHNKIVVAQARELVGYIWAALQPLAEPNMS